MAVKQSKKSKGKVQVAQQNSAKKSKKEAKVKPAKKQEPEEEESSEEEEPMEVVPQVKATKKTPAKKTPAKQTPAKKTPAKQTKKAPPKVEVEEDSDEDDSDEDDSEEEEEVAPQKATKAAAPEEEDDDDEEDSDEEEEDSDEEEEEELPVKKGAKAAPKQVEIDDDEDDEEDSDDDDDDEDDSDEEEEEAPAKGAKKAAKQAEVEEDDDEEDDDEDEEDSDDEEEEEEDEDAPPMKKKKQAGGDAKVTKKPKVEEVGAEIISIFIGGVSNGTSGEDLEEFFTSKGVEVFNARVIPNKPFGYVDVHSNKAFKQAMELNHQELNGNALRLERGKDRGEKTPRNAPQSSGGRNDSNNRTLFVKGLCFDTTEDTLREKFNCNEVRMPTRDGRPAGYAYLEFSNESEVEKAMSSMQGAEVDGWNVILDYVGDKSNNQRRTSAGGGGRGPAQPSTTLYIKGLTDDVSEGDIKLLMEALEVRRPNRRDGTGKADYAYADFDTESSAKEAFEKFQGSQLKSSFLNLDYAISKKPSFGDGGDKDKKTLYIRGMSAETRMDQLESHFPGADSVRMPMDRDTNQPKGFAYAEYSSEGAAAAALEKLQGSDLDGYSLAIDYARARTSFGSPRGGRGNFGGGFRGGRGGGFRGGRGGGGRGGGFRGGRGGGGRGGGGYQGKRTTFD